MALTLGSVSIAADGTETKSGSCGRLYDILKARANGKFAIPSGSSGVSIKKGLAELSTDLATWFDTEIKSHVQAKIPNSAAGDGLQRTPDPNDPNTNTQRPSADKFLSLV